MKILAIETSCDETGAAVVEKLPTGNLKIHSNIVASSADMHAASGGVIPEEAAREQIKSIIPVVNEALKGLTEKDIDAIAVTVGPGLIGSLLVGVETAKTLAYLWNKPIVPVNHLIGHVYANFLPNIPRFPALALVVSGGHTDLIYMKDHGKIKYIGGTRDDAAGEAFDKSARLLDLPYPGGPSIAARAKKYSDENPGIKLNLFPRPMLSEHNFDWSFSGLKTSVLNYTKKNPNFNKEHIAAEIQEAIVDSLVEKCLNAIRHFNAEGENVKSFLLAGGVAANTRLREKFQGGITSSLHGRDSGKLARDFFHVPEVALCTDNAAPIAAAAFFDYHPVSWQNISVNPQLTITD